MGKITMKNAALAFILTLSIGVSGQVLGGGPSSVLSRSRLSPQQRVLGLSLLWSEAKFGFAYYSDLPMNWDSLYEDFIPRVLDAKTDYDYYLQLMKFYAYLKDGHSGVFWPAEFNEALGYPPIEIRKIDGRAVVFRLLKNTEELSRNHIVPGLTIVKVDGRPVSEMVAYWRELKTASTQQATDRLDYFRVLAGPRNSIAGVVLEEPDGTMRTAQLTRSEAFFNDINLEPTQLYSSRRLETHIGYFQANGMRPDVAEAFARFIQDVADMTALILDLRYNGGGDDAVSFDMVSRLINAPLDGPIYEVTTYRADRRAHGEEQEIVREPKGKIEPTRGKHFTGPLIVLIGEQTQSATESGFLAVIRNRPSTLFVGQPTAGSTGQPMIFELPGGAIGAVCGSRTEGPGGRRFVGTGFQPDISISPSREDLFRGRDSALEKAIQVLNQRPNL
jgi:carboxyl-terminal processing protease